MSRHIKGLLLTTLVLTGYVLADVSSTTAKPSTARPRAAKTTKQTSTTPSTTTVSKATHPPYPYDGRASPTKKAAKYPYADMINQYDPSQVTGNPIPRSTYAPYVYGSDPEPARKKHLLSPLSVAIDRDTVAGWARDVVAYLAAPFLIPSAITNAFNTPPGLPEQSSLWGKIARSFRAAWFRRSEDRDGSEVIPGSSPTDQLTQKLVQVMKNRIRTGTSKILKQLKERKLKAPTVTEKISDQTITEEPEKELKKKQRLLPVRILDLFRMKRHRTSENSAATVALEKLSTKSE